MRGVGAPRSVALSVQLQTVCWLVCRCSLLRQVGSSAPASSLHCAARALEPAQLLLCDRPRRSNLPRGRSTEYLYVASGRSATPGRPATRPTQTTPGSAGPRGRSGLPGVGRPPGRSRLPRGHAQNAPVADSDRPRVKSLPRLYSCREAMKQLRAARDSSRCQADGFFCASKKVCYRHSTGGQMNPA